VPVFKLVVDATEVVPSGFWSDGCEKALRLKLAVVRDRHRRRPSRRRL
jgi:hypothetical protein